MNSKRTSQKHRRKALLAAAALLAVGAGIVCWRYQSLRADPHANLPSLAGRSSSATNVPSANPAAGTNAWSAAELAGRKALFANFRKHPFAVAREDAAFAWTAEDGKRPEVIQQLAHNELEFERMAEEGARIFRRQLVYAKATADQLVQQSRLSGEPIRQLALPGLDGKEFQVEISRTDLSPSGQQGTLSGHLAGRLDSTVTLAFKGGREAYTILSPLDDTYLVGEPREPGELIVKSINPATYVVGVCGNP